MFGIWKKGLKVSGCKWYDNKAPKTLRFERLFDLI